jgi:uncharacterized membrane protein YcaP (DUF421 family)
MWHGWSVNWSALFVPHTSLLEILIRGTVTYVMLFLLLRIGPKREAGAAGITDLLVVVLIADAAQNAMAGSYTSITEGVVLVMTIIFWSWTLNWVAYRSSWFERFVMGPPLPLVRNGKLLRQNMRRELISEDELMSQLRLQGVNSVAEVRMAAIEPDGRISVVMRKSSTRTVSPEKRVG